MLGLGQGDSSLMWCTFLHYLHATHKLVDVDSWEVNTLFRSRACTTEASTIAKMPRTMHNKTIENFMIDWQPRCNS